MGAFAQFRRRSGGLFRALTALTAATMVVAFVRTHQWDDATNRLRGIYQKALYESSELTEGMAVNFNKVSVAGGPARELLLADVIRQAQGVQADLAVLPLSGSAIAPAMKYINQAGDFCQRLLTRLGEGDSLSSEDAANLTSLSETAAQLSLALNAIIQEYEAGQWPLTDRLIQLESLSGESAPAVDYPTLLYDGPFSDGATGGEFKALAGMGEISAQEAEQLLRNYVGADRVTKIALDGESSLPTPCYGFSLEAGGYHLSAAVTKMGGQVLYLLCSDDVTGELLSLSQCFRAAETFLLSRGYSGMELNYYSKHDGILTANYAATQNGVTLYPDLVKIQISMADGAILGVEAGNYLRNHVPRSLDLPALTEAEARARVNPALSVESVRLCVIPTDAAEVYCYEISCSGKGGTYLVYLDAVTGAEVDIMQVVGDAQATLVM